MHASKHVTTSALVSCPAARVRADFQRELESCRATAAETAGQREELARLRSQLSAQQAAEASLRKDTARLGPQERSAAERLLRDGLAAVESESAALGGNLRKVEADIEAATREQEVQRGVVRSVAGRLEALAHAEAKKASALEAYRREAEGFVSRCHVRNAARTAGQR